MKLWERIILPPTASLSEVIKVLDETSAQICLVTNQERVLLGTITDGDIRRGILSGLSLDIPASQIYNETPLTSIPQNSDAVILDLMDRFKVHQIPIVDHEGRVIGLATKDDLSGKGEVRENWTVLMAGGLGARLRPITNTVPKPMLKIGGRPLLETILCDLIDQGLRKFYVSVNYRAEIIQDHFGDGSNWGVDIQYIHEKEPMGTAGPLGLIKSVPDLPLIVMNSDLLTRVNFGALLEYHERVDADATMCVRRHDSEIPYGVVEVDGDRILSVTEKPVQRHLVNAGIYVVNPETLSLIPKNTPIDMPKLFETISAESLSARVFPLREYWLDIGNPEDLAQANLDYNLVRSS